MRISDVGLVLEGGGFRGMFTAAILDIFQKHELFFDYAIGVSAGAAYGVSYVARQYQRNLDVNPYVADKRYCSLHNLIIKGNFFDWEFVYKEMPLKYVPFDYDAFCKSSTKMKIVLTDCLTGKATYKTMNSNSPDRFRDLLAGTSSLPILSRMQHIDGGLYLDGGIADSIPIDEASRDGFKRLVVVLTRPYGYKKEPQKGAMFFKMAYRKYPKMLEALLSRYRRYNETLNKIEEMERNGRAFVIRPKEAIPVSRIGNKPPVLQEIYQHTFSNYEPQVCQMRDWISSTSR